VKKLFLVLILLVAFFCALGCSVENEMDGSNSDNKASGPNILLVIADDMGLDATPGYSIGETKPSMPNLMSLMGSGIRFNNVWANPVCSPTRATILIGKYGFRTGVLWPGDALSSSETSIHRLLKEASPEYSHAIIGKWHLSDIVSQPTDMGADYFAGIMSGVRSYYSWNLIQNGQTTKSSSYITSKLTDLAIEWTAAQTQPWFLWLAYNAPHAPFHLPPSELHNQGALPNDSSSINANPLPYYMAMIEALDSEMGRLLNSFSKEILDNTLIIFIGDNGSPNEVVQTYNSKRAKGSIYQGGINVPMVVSGKNVTRAGDSEDALINGSDLFATILDVAGAGISEKNDSKSFKGLFSASNSSTRKYVYSEKYNAKTLGQDYTIRNKTHKYLFFNDGSEALYSLSKNPLENPNLLSPGQLPLGPSNSAAKDELILELNKIRN